MSRPEVVGVTASGVILRCGVLAEVTVRGGVCPVGVAGSSGSWCVTTSVSPVTRIVLG